MFPKDKRYSFSHGTRNTVPDVAGEWVHINDVEDVIQATAENEKARGYSKGYAAAERKYKKLHEQEQKIAQDERVFMQCLDMALSRCGGWQIGGKKINDAKGYCDLARVFADNAISEIKG